MQTRMILLLGIGFTLIWMGSLGLGWSPGNGDWIDVLKNTVFALFGFFFCHTAIKGMKFPNE